MSSHNLQKIENFENPLPLKNANAQTTCPCILSSTRSNNEMIQCHDKLESDDKPIKYKLYQKFLAELTGTCFLLYGCVGGPLFCEGNLAAGGLAAGFTITAIVHIFYKVSGAHFNPAVSFPCYLRKLLPLKDMLFYVLAQFIGAFVGCVLIALCRKGKFDKLGGTKVQSYVIEIGKEKKLDAMCYVSALFCELISTFFIMIFVFSISEKNNNLGNTLGLVFGVTILMLVISGANISASSFNPARSLAPAVLQAIAGGDKEPLEQIWIYIIGPMGGGSLAALFWKIFEI